MSAGATLRTRARALAAADSGAAMVEFALVAPLLFLMIFGLFEFGRAWNTYQIMTDAAREGARRIAVADGTGMAAVTTTVQNALARGPLDPARVTVTLAATGFGPGGLGDGQPGSEARVTVAYTYTFGILGDLPTLLGGGNLGTITLTTTSVMRNE